MKQLKIYKKKIDIPDNVKIKKSKNNLFFYGPLGFAEFNLMKVDKFGVVAFRFDTNKTKHLLLSSYCKRFFACICNIIENKIIATCRGFLLSMRIVGVGYRAEIIKNEINQILCFKIGLSHDFQYTIPKSVRIFLIEPTLICLYGIDKNQVTQIAAKIRQIKPPSVYKGKGIRLINEVIVMKAGKRK
jgi:large subunit ribosomal protein L6